MDLYPFFLADPELLQTVLDLIRNEYGSYEGYLTKMAGLDQSHIDELRKKLLY
jgi:hypothetical protein